MPDVPGFERMSFDLTKSDSAATEMPRADRPGGSSSESTMQLNSHDAATPSATTMWQFAPVDLHDRLWCACGVDVVRPGAAAHAVPNAGDGPWMLLASGELVSAPARSLRESIGRRTLRRSRRTAVVSIHASSEEPVLERIVDDHAGNLIEIQRAYEWPAAKLGEVLLTWDVRLARTWARSAHPARHRSAESALKLLKRRQQTRLRTCSLTGGFERRDSRDEVHRWLTSMVRDEPTLARSIPGVHEAAPLVFAHESAAIGPHVSLAGPMWIGAHVELEGQDAVIGPVVLPDRPYPAGRGAAGSSASSESAVLAELKPIRSLQPMQLTDGISGLATSDAMSSRVVSFAPGSHDQRNDSSTTNTDSTSRPASGDRAARVHASRNRSMLKDPDSLPWRVINRVIAAVGIIAIMPVLIGAMIAIMIEDGRPFFFGHRRQGLRGKPFTCWKFRTMCRGAHAMQDSLADENECDGPQFHIPDDPRLLRVGRWMRRFQIDEIPQLWNVVRGEMNLVGPRPSPRDENRWCPTWRDARLSVRPGMTGLWQVRRTRQAGGDFQEWIRFDIEYAQRRSWQLDVWILAATVREVLRPKRKAMTGGTPVETPMSFALGERDGAVATPGGPSTAEIESKQQPHVPVEELADAIRQTDDPLERVMKATKDAANGTTTAGPDRGDSRREAA